MNEPTDVPFIIVNSSVIQCREILDRTVSAGFPINLWDFVILIPNLVFALFLLVRVCGACRELKASRKPILTTFYVLVWIIVTVSILRSVVSIFLKLSVNWEDDIEKAMWLLQRFFLLAAELAIVLFGLGFGSSGVGSKSTIRKILIGTSICALVYSTIQAALEFLQPDRHYHMDVKNYDLYGNGGMLFLFATSCLFFLVYAVIIILPYTRMATWYHLPARRGFYIYSAVLAILNMVQAIGSMLQQQDFSEGLCIVDGTTLAYFTLFAPFLYFTFLGHALSKRPARMAFSYLPQVDDQVADDVSRWSVQGGTPATVRRKKVSPEPSPGDTDRTMCDTTSTGLEDSSVTLGPGNASTLYSSSLYGESRGSSFADAGGSSTEEARGVLDSRSDWMSPRYGDLGGRLQSSKASKACLAMPT